MTDEAETVPLLITLGLPGDGTLDFRFPPQYEKEICALLDKGGISHGTVREFSAAGELWIEAVRVLSVPGGLAALAAVIKEFLHRHDGKRFTLDGEKIEAEGFSKEEIEQVLKNAAERQADHDAAWQRLRDVQNAGEDGDA